MIILGIMMMLRDDDEAPDRVAPDEAPRDDDDAPDRVAPDESAQRSPVSDAGGSQSSVAQAPVHQAEALADDDGVAFVVGAARGEEGLKSPGNLSSIVHVADSPKI